MKRGLPNAFRFIVLGGLVFLSVPSLLRAQVPAPTEYQVKAAFLYNFAKFVDWPAEAFQGAQDTLVIGILGNDPFGTSIEADLSGKTVQDKKLIFKRLASPDEASGCQVVFISDSEEAHIKTILNKLQKAPILTVSDMKGFIQHGGMIGMVLENNKVAFNINQTVAESAGLKISSQLLKLAKVIAKNLGGKPLA